MGLRESILAAKDNEPVPFECEWGKIYIRRFTGAQAAEWQKFAANSFSEDGKLIHPDTFRAKLVQLSVVDEKNELVFPPTDVSQLTTKNAAVVAQIFTEAVRVNALTPEEVANARRNFLHPSSTGTASPGSSA
jgi:hypothetical protein